MRSFRCRGQKICDRFAFKTKKIFSFLLGRFCDLPAFILLPPSDPRSSIPRAVEVPNCKAVSSELPGLDILTFRNDHNHFCVLKNVYFAEPWWYDHVSHEMTNHIRIRRNGQNLESPNKVWWFLIFCSKSTKFCSLHFQFLKFLGKKE